MGKLQKENKTQTHAYYRICQRKKIFGSYQKTIMETRLGKRKRLEDIGNNKNIFIIQPNKTYETSDNPTKSYRYESHSNNIGAIVDTKYCISLSNFLPAEMLSHIFEFLPIDENIWNVAFTSKTFLKLIVRKLKINIDYNTFNTNLTIEERLPLLISNVTIFDKLNKVQRSHLKLKRRRRNSWSWEYIKRKNKCKSILSKIKSLHDLNVKTFQEWNALAHNVGNYCKALEELDVMADISMSDLDFFYEGI